MTDIQRLAEAVGALTAALGPSPAPARVVSGDPRCAELVLVDQPGLEVGLWEVTAGEFLSTKAEVGEVMHFLSGAGRIVHPDGSETEIAPGVTLSLKAGWSGRWEVTETARKVYVIYRAEGDADGAS